LFYNKTTLSSLFYYKQPILQPLKDWIIIRFAGKWLGNLTRLVEI
jgi:hypothetical protein